MKETRDEENNIIIRNSTLCNILPNKLKNYPSIQSYVCVWLLHIYKKFIHHYYHGVRFFINIIIKSVMHRTEGMVKRSIIYFKKKKLCNDTWRAYVLDSIWHYDDKNVCIYIVKLCITTLEICFDFLCAISMDGSSKTRIRSAQFKC